MTDFQEGLMELQGKQTLAKIASVILGPYHGWGPCDGAVHVAEDALFNFAGNNKCPITEELVLKRFSSVRNHEARVMPKDGFKINTKVGTFTGIHDCFHFEYEDTKGKIFGWKLSEDAADNVPPHCTWPLEHSTRKRVTSSANTSGANKRNKNTD